MQQVSGSLIQDGDYYLKWIAAPKRAQRHFQIMRRLALVIRQPRAQPPESDGESYHQNCIVACCNSTNVDDSNMLGIRLLRLAKPHEHLSGKCQHDLPVEVRSFFDFSTVDKFLGCMCLVNVAGAANDTRNPRTRELACISSKRNTDRLVW